MDVADFSLEFPEDLATVASSLQVHSEKTWAYLAPSAFVRSNRTISFKYSLDSPFLLIKNEDTEHDTRPIKSLSANFADASVPAQPACKPPPSKNFYDVLDSFFRDRPIWLKNALVQQLPNAQRLPKNHLKQ